MDGILLITPPFLQPNTPYPATAYLTGYLRRRGISCEQADLSIDTLNGIFSPQFLERMFAECPPSDGDDFSVVRIHSLRRDYVRTVDSVMRFLRGEDSTLSTLICQPGFLPQGPRLMDEDSLEEMFGPMGQDDCARHLCTLFLQDLSDYIRARVCPDFEIVRYAESIAMAVRSFADIRERIYRAPNMIESLMTDNLEGYIRCFRPRFVGFAVPFPGNLVMTLRCAAHIRSSHPDCGILMGGGYPTTELRQLADKAVFDLVDWIVLDDGEIPVERIVTGGELTHTFTRSGYHGGEVRLSQLDRGCPDFSGLDGGYFSILETVNPMHRLWNSGRWNKMVLAHGCYWARCAFCDTSLDYIGRYSHVDASVFADWMDSVYSTTGSQGFHFVDEAAPPRLLKELSLELIRRGRRYCWWTNIRFEKAFTEDLCALMAEAGCVAVSGGLETADDRLLGLMGKGVDVRQAAVAMGGFYKAGIMVHAYLMYGFPTESLQETVDSMETVRQLFRAHLIDSAFWHRYAMTVHSPSGMDCARYGATHKATPPNPFANNEIPFTDHRGYDIQEVGRGLSLALENWMVGEGLDTPLGKWFRMRVPETQVEPTLITDTLIVPDRSRLFDASARLVFTGAAAMLTDNGLLVMDRSGEREIKMQEGEAEFMAELLRLCSDPEREILLGDAQKSFPEYSDGDFIQFYHSKKFDRVRRMGLLQV